MKPLSELVTVSPSNAVILGDDIACDGFYAPCKARVQTHAHDDHLRDLNSSKKSQDIFLTSQTRALLGVRKEFFGLTMNCSNVREVAHEEIVDYQGNQIQLLHSNHILGGVQVSVQLPDGRRVGYSSDFDWPLDQVIKVDALVVDSTGGHPSKVLQYDQGAAEAALLDIVSLNLQHGPIDICGSQRGIVQRAMNILTPMFPDIPFLCSAPLEMENKVYRRYGYQIKSTLDDTSPEGRQLLANSQRAIRFRGRTDKRAIVGDRRTKITLSPFPNPGSDPVNVWSSKWPEKVYTVGLYDHADFLGSLDYIQTTGAKFVLTDSRGQYAYEFAAEIRSRLNIESKHSPHVDSVEWGN